MHYTNLRRVSKYASTSDAFQNNLLEILKGLGKSESVFNHASIVVFDTPNIFLNSSDDNIFSITPTINHVTDNNCKFIKLQAFNEKNYKNRNAMVDMVTLS